MTDTDALPVGTVLKSEVQIGTYERVEAGWVRVNPWGARTFLDEGLNPDLEYEVYLVPAEWLTERLQALIQRADQAWPDAPAWLVDAMTELAIDAGLS